MTEVCIEIRDLKKYYAITQKKGFSILDLPQILKHKRSRKDPIKKVLDGINLDIYQGECFGIIGPNGVGKSTLLRLIAGIIPPDSGSIKVNGSLIPLLSLGVGFSDELNAHDNIYQYGMILGFSKKEMDGLYDKIIAFSGLEQYQYTPLKNFSSGMRVKLGFSTAVQISPDILLLDEVLAVGDISFKEKSRQKILEFCSSDKTVVIVSHSMTTISDLCDRVMYLKDGKIGSIGGTKEVIEAYVEAMHQYLGPKDLVFIQGQIQDRENQIFNQDRVRQINRQVSDLHLTPLIREFYDSGVERSLFEYLMWKNLKKFSQLEEVLAGISAGTPKEEFIVGYFGTSFITELGEKERSRTVASRLIKNFFSDGYLCYGNDDPTAFFSGDKAGLPVSGQLLTILVKDGARAIPVLVDAEKKVTIDDSSAFHILNSIRCNDPASATLVIPPEMYTRQAIAALTEKKIRLLAPVPGLEIEENRDLMDFLDGIVSPDRMQVFIDKPLFTKKGRFVIQGHEIDGYGYFNPRLLLESYTSYFSKLETLNTIFEGADLATSIKPELYIREIAKRHAMYFSGTEKDGSLSIRYNFDTIQDRQKLIGTVFLYHSGDWDAMGCYRNYERWKLTNDAVNLYCTVIASDEPLFRGRALLSLIDRVIWAGML
jgi:lipopolysaccharide transport system ATP-binding protein